MDIKLLKGKGESTSMESGQTTSSSGASPYITLIRPLNAVMAGVGVFVGGIVAAQADFLDQLILTHVLLAYLAAFFATGAGNALNDIVDAETDKVNHPERPIPSGALTKDQVKRVVFLGYGLTLLIAAVVNYLTLLIAIVNISLMIAYEMKLKQKGFIGNLTISYLTGSVFLFGGVATLENAALMDMVMEEATSVTLILAFLAFLASAGREVIKDIQDMEGDKDRITLPMRIGKKNAGIIASGMILIAVALSWLPYQLGILGEVYLASVLAADALFVYTVVLSIKDPARSQKMAKYAMLVALIAFLAGAVF